MCVTREIVCVIENVCECVKERERERVCERTDIVVGGGAVPVLNKARNS